MTGKRITAAFPLTIALALVVSFFGCEEEPQGLSDLDQYFASNPYINDPRPAGENVLHVRPTEKTISTRDEQVVFRARGGTPPYFWGVANSVRGSVQASTINSDTCVYTVHEVAPNSVVVNDVGGRSAIGSVTVLGVGALKIVPDAVGFVRPNVGDTAQFVVSGGVPPYGPWTTSFANLGTVSAGGTYFVASDTLTGTNLVTVYDSHGILAQATVSHSMESPELTIIPSDIELTANGEQAWFLANGGTPPFAWSLTFPGRGAIVSVSADTATMVYRRTAPGDQIIILTDAAGKIDQETITQDAPSPPAISPSTALLASNQVSVVFSVGGGTPAFTWGVISGHGTVAPSVGTQTAYSRSFLDPPGNYIVRVTDSTGQSALATVQQQ